MGYKSATRSRTNEAGRLMHPATFADAYTAWHGPIRAWLYNAVHDLDIAEDIAAEAFCRALENWHKFTPTHEQSVKAWLYTIAKNTLIDHNRRRASIARKASLYRYPRAVDDWHVVNARLDVEAVWPQLTDDQRITLGLTALGYNDRDGGAVLGMTRQAFRGSVFRGRRSLARLSV